MSKPKRITPDTTLLKELEVAIAQGLCKRPFVKAAFTLDEDTGQKKKDLVLAPLVAIPDKLYTVEPCGSWAELALMLSLNLPGQFWLGSAGITHVCGSKVAWITHPTRVDTIQEARLTTHRILSDERFTATYTDKQRAKYDLSALPYSVSACARLLLSWTGCQQRSRELDKLQTDTAWSYQYCEPRLLPKAYLWDITSCYYSLLQRAPSPYVVFLEGELFFPQPEQEERLKWWAMVDGVGGCKALRNSLVGSMFSANDGHYFFDGRSNQGEDRKPKKDPIPGLLRPLASLIVRSAYELCAIACEQERGVYANTDCVVTVNPWVPRIWERYGLKVSLKGAGRAEICAIGNYRVGNHRTIPYALHRKGDTRPSVPYESEGEEKALAKLILKGDTWCDKWLIPSDSFESSQAQALAL